LTCSTASVFTCSGAGTNIGAALAGREKGAVRTKAVRADKSFFIIDSFSLPMSLGHHA
jgi:hypothetical protein